MKLTLLLKRRPQTFLIGILLCIFSQFLHAQSYNKAQSAGSSILTLDPASIKERTGSLGMTGAPNTSYEGSLEQLRKVDFEKDWSTQNPTWAIASPTTKVAPTHSSARVAGTPTRYLSLNLLNVSDQDFYISLMEKYAAVGINSFQLNVNWEKIHHKRGDAPDWAILDNQAAIAERLGCKIMLRIWVARHDDGDGGWWPVEARPESGDGNIRGLLGGFSFSDTKAVDEVNGFVREVMEHFRPRQQAGQILWVSVANTDASEIGYTVSAYNPEKMTGTIQTFDYNSQSILAFQGWAQAKYKTLTEANKAWGSDFSRFSDIRPPYIKDQPWSAHYGKIGEDWYLFRHWALKNVITKLRNTVREVDPSYKFCNDMGSCYDAISNIRGTLAFKDLCKDTDGLKVNDAPTYPHRFAMDLLRSSLPGKIIGNEVERISLDYRWYWRDQIDQSFEHGADWVNVFGFYENNLSEIEGIIKEMAAKWLNSPKLVILPTQTVTYTLSEAIKQGTGDAQTKWQYEYGASKKPIKVILLEDLLGETSITNLPPVVKIPLVNKQATTDKRFEYEIPKETFSDPDGIISGITAQGLPSGLTLNGWRVEGTVLNSGEYTITITATDNEGSQVATQFKLFVETPPFGNVFSLFTAGNLITRRLLRTIQEGDTLRGEGIKGMTNILVSPLTGLVGSYSFEMVGPKSANSQDSEAPFGLFGDDGGIILTPGKYTLTVKSYAGANLQGEAIGSQTIHFIVEYDAGTPTPAPSKLLVDQTAKLGSPYTYNLPDSVFLDPGTTFTSFNISSLPDGLKNYGGYITGTPTKEGVFTVQVKVSNSGGRITETTFKFTITAGNLPPVAKTSIPNQNAQVTKPFSFSIPDNTFSDPDGTIASISISGLPEGLSSSGKVISGTPSKEGSYTVTVKATDNAGATVQLTFTLQVTAQATPPGPTPPPSNLLVDLTAKLGALYIYNLPDSVFLDPGTTFTSFNISYLPDGLINYGGYITGTPTKEGVYTVRVKVGNSGGRVTETTFKFTITAGNLPPVVKTSLSSQTAGVNKPYSFSIPDNTFSDPDGTIASISISGLPEGLSSSGKAISGTPSKEGSYTVTVTATDNAGATVKLTFTLQVTAQATPPGPTPTPAPSNPLVDLTAKLGALYIYNLPDSVFLDPGTTFRFFILSNLPDGLKNYGGYITGTPTKEGVYTVQVKVGNSGGRITETTFKFTITAGNLPPVANGTISNQTIELNKPISYNIPDNFFSDPDGTIASISISGLPPGLSSSGKAISGTPSKEGSYTVTVTATDNAGATVKLTFTLQVTTQASPPTPAPSKPLVDLTAKLGLPLDYNLPDNVFLDPGTTFTSFSISNLPDGLKNYGGYITGTPTKEGVFTVQVKVSNSGGRVTETTFKFTITAGNLPPVVKTSIPNLNAEINKPYSFSIPDNTFSDPDGTIASISISGLPEGLSSSGKAISGTPSKGGSYTVTVTATDNAGATVQLTFKLTVLTENKPPILTKPISDLELIMGQVFYFDVASYFTDPDGTIRSISYSASLPPGITANGSVIAGNPTAVGEYMVKAIAKDDIGAATEITFKIIVKNPELHIFLYQAGINPPKLIRELNNADVISLGTLPSVTNIFVESNADITFVSFLFTGPVNQNMIADKKPFGLFWGDGGFSPKIGIYKLEVVAKRNGTLVAKRYIQFEITANNPRRQGVEEFNPVPETELWKPYPNPFIDHVRIQTAAEGSTRLRSVEVFSTKGKALPLRNSKWQMMDQLLLDIDLSETTPVPGIYLLRITDENGEQKVLRILKDPAR